MLICCGHLQTHLGFSSGARGSLWFHHVVVWDLKAFMSEGCVVLQNVLDLLLAKFVLLFELFT